MRYHFADCVLDTNQYTLCRAGQLIRLRPKPFQVLSYLLIHHDRVVTKQELAEQFWPDQFITDAVVENTLKAARQAVGDSGRAQTIIRTVRGVGYRVVVSIITDSDVPEVDPPLVPAELDTDQELAIAGEPTLSLQPPASDAERRQLTVLVCRVVDSTSLSSQMALEDYLAVLQAYHRTCADVIKRLEGYLAQHLEDGLLTYFGYPLARENDAHRAIRASLEIMDALKPLSHRLEQDIGIRLKVQFGIHTGLVIIGALGTGERREPLALGETPKLAAQLQSLAEPGTVVISQATARLVQGYFTLREHPGHTLPGMMAEMRAFQVMAPTEVQNRLDAAGLDGLTPMVNREAERSLFFQHWEQVQEGRGRVIIVNGEAGIGKSRLVQTMRDTLDDKACTQLECWCSPYYQNSAWYPVIELWQRCFQEQDEDTPQARLQHLETTLAKLTLPLEETLPLMASLLSLPYDEHRFPTLSLSPQAQRDQTLETMLAMTLALASRQPVLFLVEDLHWADPSTLEFLDLLVEQIPTSHLCLVCTCRPSASVTWGNRSYCYEISLDRLSQRHVEEMMVGVARGKRLPADVLEQVGEKTDGVPLFVEELTKTVLETEWLRDAGSQYDRVASLSDIAIPTTLHDSLMARLDRLDTAKRVAQLGATLGREFSYDLLREVSPWEEEVLQQDLRRLVDAELVFQRGLPSQATYVFKHNLVQEAAYQSLVRHQRQHYHQRAAEALSERFSALVETQPERLAYHFTEAGLTEEALRHWHQAGLHAVERAAHVEASRHLTTGLELLATLPDTPEHAQQELDLLLTYLPVLAATQGAATPERERLLRRAYTLCQQLEASEQVFGVLVGLCSFHHMREEIQTAREWAEACLQVAQGQSGSTLLLSAHFLLGSTLYSLGDFALSLDHLEQGIALYDPKQHANPKSTFGLRNCGESCLSYAAWCLRLMGYPEQALVRTQEALVLARQLTHPYSLAWALLSAIFFHESQREIQAVRERAEEFLALVTEYGFTSFTGHAWFWQGWALGMTGQAEGLDLIHQGLAAIQSTGSKLGRRMYAGYLSDVHRQLGQVDEGLRVLAEVQPEHDDHWSGMWYRHRGELLMLAGEQQTEEAERCLQQALAIMHAYQTKWWELQTAKSLSRLWQQQGKHQAAYNLLAPIYNWFTEGFDTADLQEAKALLNELELES
ncbi:MAG: hypothetical protein ETSY1_47050 (plasmid) [Candidatus Entotheonella factor]|uniref:OmpR/PhoB-type domain-containing protein n=1 Tax=Entotheonella factor TaxID=1429438 RepID=W4M014_ENTF1|nr:AAA family ATPase [Candidatus Entotheonella palauensis]ETX03498.1 MAG: hypothetical protein ETSY1_47050 [Candidatus Entotheonella factor]